MSIASPTPVAHTLIDEKLREAAKDALNNTDRTVGESDPALAKLKEIGTELQPAHTSKYFLMNRQSVSLCARSLTGIPRQFQ